MIAVQNARVSTPTSTLIDASKIPALSKKEAKKLALAELQNCIDMLRQLSGEDWQQPTDCTEWNVKDMAAHLAGACAGNAVGAEFRRQYVSNPHSRKGEAPIHGINRCQVADRAGHSTEEIIAELEAAGPKAVRNRQRIPFFIRAIRAPMAPLGVVSVRYLMDTIYTRDQWMHRADISRATGKHMLLTPAHDGRIVDLVMSDFLKVLRREQRGKRMRPVQINLTGELPRSYIFGTGQPEAILTLDLLEFNRLASGRTTPESTRQLCRIEGDAALGMWVLEHCEVGF